MNWTEAAQRELHLHIEQHRAALTASPAGLDQWVQQVRLQALEEASRRRSSDVTDEIVRHILRRIVLPEPQRRERSGAFEVIAFLLGIVFPAAVLGLELATGFCASVFFDPLPTFAHVAAVAAVPLINLWVWRALRREAVIGQSNRLLVLCGIGTGICLFYALWFLPLLPFALVAVILYGLGFLPLAPLLSLVGGGRLLSLLVSESGRRTPGRWGMAAGLAAMLLITAPLIATSVGLYLTTSPSEKTNDRGLWLLRNFGSETALLRRCYDAPEGLPMLVALYLRGAVQLPTDEHARHAFFRTTGEPLATRPPPQLSHFARDVQRGTDVVGPKQPELSLASSRFEAEADVASATSYTEWTLVFRNSAQWRPREARAQVALPPGAVVSRLTLWVHGVPQEAAFGGRAHTVTAYQEIVGQDRDPVLVTTSGRDRVLVQCFPVPAGGEMKVRLGITAPLRVEEHGRLAAMLPRIVEQNFMSDGIAHALQFHGAEIPFADTLPVASQLGTTTVWTPDPLANDGSAIIQQLQNRRTIPPAALHVVVDGSRPMRQHLRSITAALRTLPPHIPLTIHLAEDYPRQMDLEKLERTKLKGGHTNLPALARAFAAARQTEGAAVLWIHGPQPFLKPGAEQQLQEMAAHRVPLFELTVAESTDVLAPKLEEHRITSQPVADLHQLIDEWRNPGERPTLVRERRSAAPEGATPLPQKSAAAVRRLWAFEEVHRLIATNDPQQLTAATQLGMSYRLVTPVTGAVVLETKQDYERAGLDPNTPDTAAVPEPATWLLLCAGAALFIVVQLRRRASARRGALGNG